jgi:hypothetical protein
MFVLGNTKVKNNLEWSMSDPEVRNCLHSIDNSRIRDGACPIPYIRIRVELVGTEEKVLK